MTNENLENKIDKKVASSVAKAVAGAATGLVTTIGGLVLISAPSNMDQSLVTGNLLLCTAYVAYNFYKAGKYSNQKSEYASK